MRGPGSPFPEGTEGQWLLLSAIIVAVGLGALVLLLNMAILSGHSSTQSIMSFPKNDIRDLRYYSLAEAAVIGHGVNANASITAKTDAFNASFDRFVGETVTLYTLRGELPAISRLAAYNDTLKKITSVTVGITYTDGTTSYTENATVGVS